MAGEPRIYSDYGTGLTNASTGGTISASMQTWGNWNYTLTTTNSSLTNNQIFGAWVLSSMMTSASTSNVISTTYTWSAWNGQIPSVHVPHMATPVQNLIQASPEQVKKRLEDEKRYREEYLAAEKKRNEEQFVARARGMKLLVSCLLPEQKKDLAEKKYFILESIGKDGKRTKYRIDQGTHGNVKLLDEKLSVVGSYCVQPNDVVVEDSMLAQKLWLESDPEAFKRAANYTPNRR